MARSKCKVGIESPTSSAILPAAKVSFRLFFQGRTDQHESIGLSEKLNPSTANTLVARPQGCGVFKGPKGSNAQKAEIVIYSSVARFCTPTFIPFIPTKKKRTKTAIISIINDPKNKEQCKNNVPIEQLEHQYHLQSPELLYLLKRAALLKDVLSLDRASIAKQIEGPKAPMDIEGGCQ